MRRALLGVLAAAVVAGCGGSDSDEDESRSANPSSNDAGPEYVRRVDALCRDANPQLARIQTAITSARDAGRAGRVSPSRTFETFAMLLRRASAITERLQARLRSVEAPPGERAFHDALLGSLAKGALNLREQVTAAEAQDARTLRDLSVKGTVINAAGKGLIAGHGGFRFCGRG